MALGGEVAPAAAARAGGNDPITRQNSDTWLEYVSEAPTAAARAGGNVGLQVRGRAASKAKATSRSSMGAAPSRSSMTSAEARGRPLVPRPRRRLHRPGALGGRVGSARRRRRRPRACAAARRQRVPVQHGAARRRRRRARQLLRRLQSLGCTTPTSQRAPRSSARGGGARCLPWWRSG